MVPEEVKLEMAREMIHHRKEDFKEVFSSVQRKLKILFGTKELVLVLTSSGTGAMQASVSNLFSPKEEVVVVVGGKFGQRWREIAERFELKVNVIEVEWGKAVNVEEIEQTLKKNKNIRGILIQASETSTGVLHPIKEIGEITRSKDVLLVVDGISAVGVSPCPMDEWHIDCLITGSQKGLMIPPGLSMISLSQKAWEKAKNVKKRDFYFDLLKEKEKQNAYQTLFTPSVVLIRALDKALDVLLKDGLDEVYRKYWALTCMVRKGIWAIGLKPMVEKNYTWGLTSVLLPKEVDGQKLLKDLKDEYNLILAGGQDKLKGKIIRIGYMGDVDWIDILGVLSSLKEVLDRYVKLDSKPNFLEIAVSAYKDGLKNYGCTRSM